MEAAETLEEAVRREAFEETGIIVDRVAYHSSQPWVKIKFEICQAFLFKSSFSFFTVAFSQLSYAWFHC